MIREDKPSGKVVCHSKAPNGEELITVEVELHRFILPEFNTHRVMSRNFQSSRAVPIQKLLKQVYEDPALPVHWGKNQQGMVANEELDVNTGKHIWLIAARKAAHEAQRLNDEGYHKQIVNRLLEPFMWTKGVVTATREGWDSFFKLRCHPAAQPEIKLLAERIEKAINESIPAELDYGEYHLPYVQDYNVKRFSSKKTYEIQDAIKISTSCTAQVSYRVLDDSLEKALKIYDMLNLPINGVYPDDPPHYSPTEHVAKVTEEVFTYIVDENGYDVYTDGSGNFHSNVFWQYRKALEVGLEGEFIK